MTVIQAFALAVYEGSRLHECRMFQVRENLFQLPSFIEQVATMELKRSVLTPPTQLLGIRNDSVSIALGFRLVLLL